MELNKVSVIIATHNGSNTVKKAVDSVLNQTYKNIEVIVVDDNGLGKEEQLKTEKTLSEYIDKGKVRYIPNLTNMNGSVARNTGFKVSRGEFIGFLDDDDVYEKEKIKKSVSFLLANNSFGAVYTDTKVLFSDYFVRLRSKKSGTLLYDTLNHTIFMNPSTLLIRRTIVEKLNGFDESFQRHQDYEFNVRLANECKIGHIDYYGSYYYSIEKRHSNIEKNVYYRSYFLKKMLPYILKLPKNKRAIVYAKNSIDLFGFHYHKCKDFLKTNSFSFSFLGFVFGSMVAIKEKIKYKCGIVHGKN